MTKWWMIRAGDNNELMPIWKQKGIVSIGWPQFGDPRQYRTKNMLREKADIVFSEAKPQSRNSWTSQVWRFSREIEEGDRIISYSKEKRAYLIGKVTKSHFYDTLIGNQDYPNTLKVDWESKTVDRDRLSQAAKNTLGSVLTVFRVDQWGNEIIQLLGNQQIQPIEIDDVEPVEDEVIEDFIGKALAMVEDQVDKLDPWQMQDLVGGLLQAMKYNVRVSPKGPDGGVDVLAYKDSFGFEKPIIKVQVKHRKVTASAPEVQQLLGANPIDGNCLFISTGGFTAQAQAVAKHNTVTIVDLEELVRLVVQWYETIPNEIRALLPLQRIYVPE